MLEALDEPVLDESDIVSDSENRKTIEDRILSLEIENAEMRVRLTELDDIVKDTPNNMELGGKVRGL
jgi:hypothetical protein